MKSVLVTGGTGFIGSNLIDALLSRGLDVVAADKLMVPNTSPLEQRQRKEEVHSREIEESQHQNLA